MQRPMIVCLSEDKQILLKLQELCEYDSRFGFGIESEVLVLCIEPDTLNGVVEEGNRVVGVYSGLFTSQADIPTEFDPVLGNVPECLAKVSMLFKIHNESLLHRSNELYMRAKDVIDKPVEADSFYDRYRGIV